MVRIEYVEHNKSIQWNFLMLCFGKSTDFQQSPSLHQSNHGDNGLNP